MVISAKIGIWEPLVALGYAIIPGHSVDDMGFCSCRGDRCSSPGKHPRIGWTTYQIRKPTEIEVRGWFTRWPDSNALIITGQVSDVVAIDIDPRHGGDEAWAAHYRPLAQKNLLANLESDILTPVSLTGGGGRHLFFKWPGYEIPNATGVFPGVDFRGDHGYVVAPGSRHVSGRTYEWDTSAHPEDIQPADLPQWLQDALRSGTRYGSTGANGELVVRGRLDVDGLIEGRVVVTEGERNETMLRFVGSLVGPDSVESTVLANAMTVNARSFIPPLDEGEVARIVHNIIGREHRKQQAAQAAAYLMTNNSTSVDSVNLTPDDMIQQAAALWHEAGVDTVTDWFVMKGGDTVSYVLVTPATEVSLGSDLLDYKGLRKTLLSLAGVLMPWQKTPADWDRRALLLHLLAREEVIAPLRASERVDEWVALYYVMAEPREPEEITHRRDYLQSQPILVDGDVWLKPQNLLRIAQREDDSIKSITLTRMMKRAGWSKGALGDGYGNALSAWHKPWVPRE